MFANGIENIEGVNNKDSVSECMLRDLKEYGVY
jgi:hypothetical protein